MKHNHNIDLKSNPNDVVANSNALWVNKQSGLICRVLSPTNNTNICEFWVMPSGSQTLIPQVAHTLERLDYKGIDYGGYDISTKQWTKYYFNNIPIIRLLWKDKLMVELQDGSYEPIERVYAHPITVKTPTDKILAIDSLIVDDNLQMRVKMDKSVIDDYAMIMSEGVEFPPLTVFEDSKQQYWLVDGFHRYYAYKLNNVKTVNCTVHKGDFFDAKLYALSANSTHGLKRSNSDKRKAVLEALCSPQLSLQSNRQIALYCGVSRRFVDKLKLSLDNENSPKHNNTSINTIVNDKTKPILNKLTSLSNDELLDGYIPTPINDSNKTVVIEDKPKLLDVSQLYQLRDNTLKTLKVGQQSKQYKDTKKLFDLFINELLKLYN